MAQGSESDVNRKGDMEKLMKHTEGVCTFVLKIHWGKSSAPKIAEKNMFKLFSFASFCPSNKNYFVPHGWMDLVQ